MHSSKMKLLDQVREKLRLKHYSFRTEGTYTSWIKRFILFHGKRHPAEMGAREIEAFLSHLAVNRRVAASTQNQAFNAILFLYRHVLGIRVDDAINAVRAKRPKRLPPGCQHHHDLHSRPQPRRPRRHQPAGFDDQTTRLNKLLLPSPESIGCRRTLWHWRW